MQAVEVGGPSGNLEDQLATRLLYQRIDRKSVV